MRRGELLGLAWSAVDLESARLSVRQTLTVINGRLSFERPKTRTSRRIVPLPAVVVDALRAHRERQEKERADSGQWTDSGLVFTTTDGRLIPPATLGKQWREMRRKAGLGQIRFHDLRHTCVSLPEIGGVVLDASFGKIRERLLPATSPFGLDQGRLVEVSSHAS